ncbi:MAG: glycosyltransferase family protein [Patiriisocius sp.]|uniref:glycosyltransferase family protein n=1 Tax=Patiriisocius sp. TaxID=2822396 RepID=UPI003EF55FB5
MRILLVGEYSNLHNSLKAGLVALGHDVTIVATGDGFKDFPADIKLKRYFMKGIAKKLKIAIYRLFNIDLTSVLLERQFFGKAKMLQGFDIVQLISEESFSAGSKVEKKIVSFLKENNNKLFLLSCGTDVLSVRHMLSDAHPYSIMKGYKDGTVDPHMYRYILKFTTDAYLDLHKHIIERVDGVIASDLDYHFPLLNHPKYLGMIPNPINIEKLTIPETNFDGPIKIFMGVNRLNYAFKGIIYFEEALAIIKEKFGDKITVEIAENLPYATYIEKYNSAHIMLDQVLSYDQGYNALEAMAKGKVVFTGAEKEFIDHYKLEKTVAINVLPDAKQIARELEKLIQNPQLIKEIGTNSKKFIAEFHDHKVVAKEYLRVWSI